MAEAKTKIIVVGPVKCGKSRLVNQIAGLESEPNLEAYVPTAGVRILEFDREIAHSTKRGGSRSVNLAVELWDCSGDQQYEACWPAILSGVVGVLLVFNPENPSGERDVVKWYSAFIAKLKLSDAQVLVLAHHMDTESFNPATSRKRVFFFMHPILSLSSLILIKRLTPLGQRSTSYPTSIPDDLKKKMPLAFKSNCLQISSRVRLALILALPPILPFCLSPISTPSHPPLHNFKIVQQPRVFPNLKSSIQR